MGKLTLARQLALHFHGNQKYGDKNYFDHHLVGVYRKVMSKYADNLIPESLDIEDLSCVAYLHDILEDTDCELTTLENIFGEVISDAVLLMTKDIGTSIGDYLFKIKQNPLARFVKVCDAEFNRDSCLYECDTKRAEYYQSTIDHLLGE